MNKQYFVLGSFLIAGITAAQAGSPTYSYFRTIDLGTTATGSFRATSAIADENGFLYMTNNQNDNVGYMDPLTANAPADVQVVYNGSSSGFGASSFMGIGIDDNGTVYASGTNLTVNPTGTVLWRFKKNGDTWDNFKFSGPSTVNGGCDAAGTGILGFGDYNNGAVRSYLAGAAPFNTLFQIGSDEPGGNVGDVIKVVADTTTQLGYQSIAQNNLAGRVDVFNTDDGYNAEANPLVEPLSSSFNKTDLALHYQQIAVDKEDQVLVVSTNRGTEGDNNTFKLYDLSQPGKGLSPYQTINGSNTGDPVFGATRFCFASAFFTQNDEKYLFLMVSENSSTWTGYVFKKNAAGVDDWSRF